MNGSTKEVRIMPPATKKQLKGKSKPEAAPRNIAAVLGHKPSRKTAREMLLIETRRLRAMFSEIAEHYVANTEGKIASIIDAIETRKLPTEKIDGMRKAVRDLTVKPQKGRRKDLSRIEKAAETLLKALEE
jgi:hypothetical protein